MKIKQSKNQRKVSIENWHDGVANLEDFDFKIENFTGGAGSYSDHKRLQIDGQLYHLKPHETDAYLEPFNEILARKFANKMGLRKIDPAIPVLYEDKVATLVKVTYNNTCSDNNTMFFENNKECRNELCGQTIFSLFINDHDWGTNKTNNYSVNDVKSPQDFRRYDFSHTFSGPFGTWASDLSSYSINADKYPKRQGFRLDLIAKDPKLAKTHLQKYKGLTAKEIYKIVHSVARLVARNAPNRYRKHYLNRELILKTTNLLLAKRALLPSFIEKIIRTYGH